MKNNSKIIDKYVGDLRDGEPHGKGVYNYANGDKYIGEFENGLKHGRGEYYFENGDQYEGYFEFDDFHGVGIYTHVNGEKYEGHFKDGKFHKKGNFILINDETNRASLKNNKKKHNNNFGIPRNPQGGIDGCLISGFGFLLIIVGVILAIVGKTYDNNTLIGLGSLIGTLIAGYFILYPFVRFFFGGRDSIAAAIATKVVEGIIVHKITKKSKKKKKYDN